MDETENVRSWRVFMESGCYLGVGLKVNGGGRGAEIAGFGVKHVDKDADVAENLGLLGGKVVFGVGVLAEMDPR